MVSIVPLNKINNTTEIINKSSIICNSHAQKRGNYDNGCLSFLFVLTIYRVDYEKYYFCCSIAL